jgi:hypothetical protein
MATGPTIPVYPQSLPEAATATLQAQRDPDDLKLPPFTWPVDDASHVTLSSSLPSELLN